MKDKIFHYADIFSWSRIVAVLIFFILVMFNNKIFGLWTGVVLIILIFLSDGVDGYVSRKTKTGHDFGAFLDILGDRVTELVFILLFTVVGALKGVMIWVLLYYIVKDLTLDYVRFYNASKNRKVPFDQVKSKVAVWAVKGRLIRFTYGFAKLCMFFGLYYLIFQTSGFMITFTIVSIYATLLISILRTIFPVVEGMRDIYNK